MTPRITTLSNGLRIVTDHVPHVSTVSLGVWVGVGTRHETPEINGVAHLVEHMLFKGTPRRSAYAISEQIESVGGHLNAYTTREQTAYYAKVLKEDTGLALDIIADMLQFSLLDDDELNRERGVILQEIGQAQDTPDDVIYDHAQATAFPAQTIGLPVLGSSEIISKLPRQALKNYIRQHYAGQRMVLSASGNVDHDELVEMAEESFTDLPSSGNTSSEAARYIGGEHREDRDLEQLHFILGFESVGYHHPDYYAHSMLSTLLGGGMSSRLFQEVREKRGLAYSVHTFASAFHDSGMFGIYAGTGPEQASELVPVICDEVLKVAEDASDEEVQRAYAQLRAGMLMGLESTMARCEHLGQSMLIHGRPVPPEETLAKLEAVDAKAVRRVARSLRDKPPTVAALGPIGDLESYDRIRTRLT